MFRRQAAPTTRPYALSSRRLAGTNAVGMRLARCVHSRRAMVHSTPRRPVILTSARARTTDLPMASKPSIRSSSKQQKTDPAEWVDRYGDVLYRYAIVRVRKQEVAEDLVQETLLAALKSQDSFEGQSAEQTWLIGILRHKIMDHIRSRSRGMAKITDDSSVDWLADFFDDRGSWRKPPDPTAVNPDSLVEKEEFWEAFDSCLDLLPPRAREAFARRVIEHEENAAISKALDVTVNNLWVILFRARTQMRRCLMHKWFGDPPEDEPSANNRATASNGGHSA
jgi:RNA polymerase sigma-70 factor (TIGR02943 family)